jgi:hypothetical protein
MSGLLFVLMLCTAAIVFAAIILLAMVLLNPNHAIVKNLQSRLNGLTLGRLAKWILPLFLALILAVWTIWGALFFLAVVWLMRQNPGSGTNFKVSENEKNTAKRVYTWLFWSPLLTVPVFIIAVINAYDSSTNLRVFATLAPLIFHIPLLAGLTSKSIFVYRHTQQGILLIALRAGIAALAISASRYPEDGLWLFLLGNGALWLFGSIWGWNQVSRGDCWVMRRKGETVQVVAGVAGSLTPQVHLEKSREFIQSFKKEEARAHALAAFRTRNRDIRLQALQVLEVLEEVEKF